MQVHEGLTFPDSAIAYLQRHKVDQTDMPAMCARQATRVRKQFEDFSSHIGKNVKRVLDIGCGLGAIDVVIAHERPIETIYLVDGDGSVERHGEYREVSEPWNNVSDAIEFIYLNVSRTVSIIPTWPKGPVDVVISLKSWGLHYPIDVYLETVPNLLERGGVLIVDLHKQEARKSVEAAGFTCVETIGTYDDPGRAILPFVRHIFKKVV